MPVLSAPHLIVFVACMVVRAVMFWVVRRYRSAVRLWLMQWGAVAFCVASMMMLTCRVPVLFACCMLDVAGACGMGGDVRMRC